MGIVIPFEVVRQDKPDTETETRIAEKEAMYRGLIAEQARLEGKTFEDVLAEDEAQNERIYAENEVREAIEIVAKREGISQNEAKLDGMIEIQEIVISALKKEPHPLMWLANEN